VSGDVDRQDDDEPRLDLWISAETDASGEWSSRDDAVDVVVTMPDGTRWAATFITPLHMQQLRDADRQTGEYLAGRYFWIARPIFTDELSRPAIEAIVADLLASGELRSAFRRLPGAIVDRAR
jgi:hypothetical protein